MLQSEPYNLIDFVNDVSLMFNKNICELYHIASY